MDHGYLVASVDYRGSTGSTVAWRTALHRGNIGLPEVADVVAALDHLVAAGLTDPARVAVEGWSWGGYVSLLAAGLHPDRFAAVVGGVPVGDLGAVPRGLLTAAAGVRPRDPGRRTRTSCPSCTPSAPRSRTSTGSARRCC